MSFINEASLKQYIDTVYKDSMGDNEMATNAKTIKTREGAIKNLSSIRDHLIQIENYISERLNNLEKKHHEDVKELIDIVRPRLQSAPALIGPRILQDRSAVTSHITTDTPTSNIKAINITDNMSLDALLITSLTDARLYPGTLMYIEKWRHFVINVSGLIAHGNVGCIFVKGPSSERGTTKYPRVRDCWNSDGCPNGDKCTYYHDPEIFGDSSAQHVRNYTNFSWMYDPNVLGPRDNHIYRKVGSLTNLTEDVENITKSDVIKMSNQLVHDFVVFALVKKYGREGNVYSRLGGRGSEHREGMSP